MREVVDRKCVGGIWCASARASGVNFQACSFNHSDISPCKCPPSPAKKQAGYGEMSRRSGSSRVGGHLHGEMSEWLKEHAWKACVGETLPRVRIPLSPPIPPRGIGVASGLGQTAAHLRLAASQSESRLGLPVWREALTRLATGTEPSLAHIDPAEALT